MNYFNVEEKHEAERNHSLNADASESEQLRDKTESGRSQIAVSRPILIASGQLVVPEFAQQSEIGEPLRFQVGAGRQVEQVECKHADHCRGYDESHAPLGYLGRDELDLQPALEAHHDEQPDAEQRARVVDVGEYVAVVVARQQVGAGFVSLVTKKCS